MWGQQQFGTMQQPQLGGYGLNNNYSYGQLSSSPFPQQNQFSQYGYGYTAPNHTPMQSPFTSGASTPTTTTPTNTTSATLPGFATFPQQQLFGYNTAVQPGAAVGLTGLSQFGYNTTGFVHTPPAALGSLAAQQQQQQQGAQTQNVQQAQVIQTPGGPIYRLGAVTGNSSPGGVQLSPGGPGGGTRSPQSDLRVTFRKVDAPVGLVLGINPADTIQAVKERLAANMDVPIEEQRLILPGGKQAMNDTLVADHPEIVSGATLHVCCRQPSPTFDQRDRTSAVSDSSSEGTPRVNVAKVLGVDDDDEGDNNSTTATTLTESPKTLTPRSNQSEEEEQLVPHFLREESFGGASISEYPIMAPPIVIADLKKFETEEAKAKLAIVQRQWRRVLWKRWTEEAKDPAIVIIIKTICSPVPNAPKTVRTTFLRIHDPTAVGVRELWYTLSYEQRCLQWDVFFQGVPINEDCRSLEYSYQKFSDYAIARTGDTIWLVEARLDDEVSEAAEPKETVEPIESKSVSKLAQQIYGLPKSLLSFISKFVLETAPHALPKIWDEFSKEIDASTYAEGLTGKMRVITRDEIKQVITAIISEAPRIIDQAQDIIKQLLDSIEALMKLVMPDNFAGDLLSAIQQGRETLTKGTTEEQLAVEAKKFTKEFLVSDTINSLSAALMMGVDWSGMVTKEEFEEQFWMGLGFAAVKLAQLEQRPGSRSKTMVRKASRSRMKARAQKNVAEEDSDADDSDADDSSDEYGGLAAGGDDSSDSSGSLNIQWR